jgi:hypothetical protein
MRRQPDDGAGAGDCPGGAWRQIVLADVDAVGAGQPRDIRSIVDDENRTARMRDFADTDRQIQEYAARNRLGAKLQPPRAAGQAGRGQIGQGPARARGDIGVENGVQPR